MSTVVPKKDGDVYEVVIDPTQAVAVFPDTLKISKNKSEQVKWVSASGRYFTVDFGNDSPFYETQFSTDFPFSGPARRDVVYDETRPYKYTVRTAGRTFDPGVIIDR